MEKKDIYKRKPRRNCGLYSITTPDLSLSARVLIDRVSKGLPVNAQLSKHIPLPPDGGDMEDWDTGMEEITDVTDAEMYASKIKTELDYIALQKQKAIDEQTGATATTTSPTTSSEAPN